MARFVLFLCCSAVIRILQHSPHLVNSLDGHGQTALHWAACKNRLTSTKLIVQQVRLVHWLTFFSQVRQKKKKLQDQLSADSKSSKPIINSKFSTKNVSVHACLHQGIRAEGFDLCRWGRVRWREWRVCRVGPGNDAGSKERVLTVNLTVLWFSSLGFYAICFDWLQSVVDFSERERTISRLNG